MLIAAINVTLPPLARWLVVCLSCAAAAWELYLGAAAIIRQNLTFRQRITRVCLIWAMFTLLGLMWRFSPLWGLAVLAIAMISWAARSYSRTTVPISPRARLFLRIIRGAVLLMVLLIAAAPVWMDQVDEPVKEAVALLIDTSASMANKDMVLPVRSQSSSQSASAAAAGGAMNRLEAVQRMLAANRSLCLRLADRYDFRVAGFDGHVQYGRAEELRATGQRTAIGDGIQRVKDDFLSVGEPIAAVMVITDGCNNTSEIITPTAQAEAMAARSWPLWLVGVGSDEALDRVSLNVRDLQAPDKVDLMRDTTISADVEGVGLAGRTVRVECKLGEQLVGTKEVKFDRPSQTRRLLFEVTPQVAGFHSLVVRVERPDIGERPLVGELELARMVHVTSRTLRILYLEGRRRHESRFIAEALAGQERFELTRAILGEPLQPETDIEAAKNFWQGFQVIVLGDCSASTFGWARLEQLAA